MQIKQCKDIPDGVFLAAVVLTAPIGGFEAGRDYDPWRARWDVKDTLDTMLGVEVPEKLFLAKARKLGNRGKLYGCTDCTCRGDYHLPSECRNPEYC